MTDFTNAELRRLDLTLLLVFLGLLKHRKATAVASELGLTQSGVSQALKRLRDIFNDELFLRRPHGLDPTGLAIKLEVPVTGAVEALRGALASAAPFDPANAKGVLRVAAYDVEQACLIPGLLRRLQQSAPELQLSVLPLSRKAALQALENADVHIALGFFWDVPSRFMVSGLYEQRFLVTGRQEVLASEPLTVERYALLDHVLVSPAGELKGVVDQALASVGKQRHVACAVPEFFPALAAVAASNCIATLPERFARLYAPALGLAIAEPPLEIRPFTVSCVIHRRNELDGRLNWVRGQLAEIPADMSI
jgi:DNA-binding transcriptional LysR family regulator